MKHTPGPWRYLSGCRGIYSGDKAVAKVYGPYRYKDCGTREANAALIAAAPDLLKSLMVLEDVYRDAQFNAPEYRTYVPEAFDEAWNKARAAIAKATGETE